MDKAIGTKVMQIKDTIDYFSGRSLCIATKHSKERVIAPILSSRLGVIPFTPHYFDTDLLGTFAGEVERNGDALAVARAKCDMAMDLTGADLAVASEGSFGPHPYLPFAYADEELMMLKDRINNFEVSVMKVSTSTNFAATKVEDFNQLLKFAKQAMFPMHGLILKSKLGGFMDMVKGIVDWSILNSTYHKLKNKYGEVYVETDMRAHLNPLRMNVIREVALDLVERLNRRCPNCGIPGFGITGTLAGLPCRECNNATNSKLANILECTNCGFSTHELYPNEKKTEDPMYCDYCNP